MRTDDAASGTRSSLETASSLPAPPSLIAKPFAEEAERIAKEIGTQCNRLEGRRTEEVIAEWVAHKLRVQESKPETVRCQATNLRSLLRSYAEQDIQALTPAQSGSITHAVAATLGHGSVAVNRRYYAQPDAVTNAQTSRVTNLLSSCNRSAALLSS